VRQCCLFPLLGFGDTAANNDIAVAAVRRFPERFVGFTLINPNHGADAARRELERGLARGMRGVKMLSGIHNPDFNHEVVRLGCEFAHEHKLFVLNHSWGPAESLRKHLEACPGACYITGHSAGNCGDLVRDFPNLYICTCPFLDWNQTERYVAQYGAERLLFGSDLQDLPIGWGAGPVLYARIPEADKRKIMGENLRKLLQLYGRPRA
jgi:predicted TIM-barrel fold metal-dependent hydrolase